MITSIKILEKSLKEKLQVWEKLDTDFNFYTKYLADLREKKEIVDKEILELKEGLAEIYLAQKRGS
jgi:hypothetical protein